MRATGIVRRIDDLGRIVIPKELRRTLRIRESDPIEIFSGREGEIILKKYSPMGEISVCQAVCGKSCSGVGKSGIDYGPRPVHCSCRRIPDVFRKINQQGAGGQTGKQGDADGNGR